MDITLQRLTITDFKGIRALELAVDGRSVSLYGDNATGKSSVYDAWLWLLTGKDSRGKTAADSGGFCIKPLDDQGKVIDRAARPAVEAELTADGRRLTLRREYYELWSKKRGSREATYDGNSTDFYINDIPKSKREYETEVAALVPAEQLRLLSDLTWFAEGMKWQERREVLFRLADVADDRTLMGQEERFAPLLGALGAELTLEELQKQQTALRKKYNAQREAIPGRIDENRARLADIEALPYDRLRAELPELEAEERRLSAALEGGQTEAIRALVQDREALRQQLSGLELDNRQHRIEQGEGSNPAEALRAELTRMKVGISYELERYHREKADADRYEKKREECRRQWSELRAQRYPGSALCPTCGQPLPPDKQAEARQAWTEHHDRQLSSAIDEGKRYSSLLAQAQERAKEQQDKVVECENEIARVTDQLNALEAAERPKISDLPGYAQQRETLSERLEELDSRIDRLRREDTDEKAGLRRERDALQKQLTEKREALALENAVIWSRERIAQLEQEARDVTARLADCDRLLDLCGEFLRWKAERVTNEVNARFRLARFRLFSEQVNGGLSPCCDVLCGGVPYGEGLNNGARVNVGLDILATLSKHYGVSVPVFVDNAESVTELYRLPGTQLIRLVVSKSDRKVRMEYEAER